jgi:hypothetical protein
MMRKPKRRVERGSDETDLFFESDFYACDFIDAMERRGGEGPSRSRPARQRVELRSEEEWLRQQLSDWDDFDPEDVIVDDN